MSWTNANLAVQGYCLTEEESRALRWGLRFPTALCLAIVVAGLALRSAPLILALVPIGAVAGWTGRHPFDLIWNHGLRHLSGAPELPPNPRPRRHAFKLATVWLLAVGLLFAFDQTTAGLVLGAVLVGVCPRRCSESGGAVAGSRRQPLSRAEDRSRRRDGSFR
jgi:hypothetical protein